MGFWRDVAKDRLSGGVLCVFLALCFLFQIGLSGRAAAAMVAPDPLAMLCSSSPGVTHAPAQGDHSGKPCPCSELCAAGLHLPALPAPSQMSGVPIRFEARIEIAVDHSAVWSASPIVRRYDARGPPDASI